MSGFLSVDELRTLTGSPQKSRQVKWLRARRIRHYVNPAGHPVVAWAWLDASAEVVPLRQRPNLEAIKGGA